MRNGKVTREDYNYLMDREESKINSDEMAQFKEAVRIISTNKLCALHNLEKLSDLNTPIAEINAIHSNNTTAKRASPNDAQGLEPKLYVCNGSRVMLTSNLCAEKGLANGSFGTVKAILYNKGCRPTQLPHSIIVQFDEYTGDSILPGIERCVAIVPRTASWSKGGQELSRQQFPLRLAWAITIHKSQGQTLNKVVINFGDKTFSAKGLEFVAVSRVKKISDLIIHVISWERFQKINNIDKKRDREDRRITKAYQKLKKSINNNNNNNKN